MSGRRLEYSSCKSAKLTLAHHPQTFSKSYSIETTPATAKVFRKRSSGVSVVESLVVRSKPSTAPDADDEDEDEDENPVPRPSDVFVLVPRPHRERGDGERDFERPRLFPRPRLRLNDNFLGLFALLAWADLASANFLARCSRASLETEGGIVPCGFGRFWR